MPVPCLVWQVQHASGLVIVGTHRVAGAARTELRMGSGEALLGEAQEDEPEHGS